MLAAAKGNTALCDYLIRSGADVASVDLNGLFSLSYYGVVRFAVFAVSCNWCPVYQLTVLNDL